MADEAVYAAGGDSNKRKYEGSPPPARRRPTGFMAPPDSGAPPPSYNNVPPPMNEIELAKQKAQEIAARLLSNSDPSKRARVENGDGAGGYDAVDTGVGQKHYPGLGLGGTPQSASYGYGGYPGPNKKIDIPNGRVGVIIGKGGETIKYLQLQSGAKIQVTRDMDADPNSTSRAVELTGTPEQIAKAEQLINDVLSEADAGGSGIVSRRVTGPPAGADQFIMKIPNNKVGLVIGKGGETIKNMQATTGARIQVIPLHLPPGDMSKERTVQIDGTSEQIEAAKQLVEEVTSENRMRGQSSMSGGYSQQGYQARPPTNWGPPGQQSGYGYVQPGSYPGPPQYSMNQPSYPGYPPQPTSGGYGPGWNQSTAPQNPQTASQGGGYDYYGQQQAAPAASQQQQAPSGDGSGYGYSQASAYSGYTPDGYGGYAYGQQPQSGGYDQYQQQGYSSAYPTQASDPAQAHAPAPAAGGQPTQPNPTQNYQAGYSAQPPSSQGGYGSQPPYGNHTAPPQAQKPGSQPQPQQSPSAQGGYAVPRSQPPTSGYPATQPGGYGAPPSAYDAYGAAAAQGGYGQPQYGGAYDAAPPPQAAGAAKASPPS